MNNINSNVSQSIIPFLNLRGLSDHVTHYIQDVVYLMEKRLGKGLIHGVILFGSVVQNQTVNHSDVDLLLLVDNNVNSQQISQIRGWISAVEIKHGYAEYPQNIFAQILRIVEASTGMYRSHFIARIEDWNLGRFTEIFNTNWLFTKLLAPENLVLNSVIMGSRIIYGPTTLLSHIFPISHFEIIKSFLMTFIIAISVLVILPLNPIYMKYALEALKWAFRAGYFYLFGKSDQFNLILQKFRSLGISSNDIDKFFVLRQNIHRDYPFAFTILWLILKIHILCLRYRL
jgi:predicted nucleotidyltransferase